MSAQVILGVDPITLKLCSKLNHPSKTPFLINISNISFSSQVTKSRLSLKTPFGSCITRSETGVKALHDPEESNETLYEVLGITDPENATPSDIEKAYKQMAKKHHPKAAPRKKVGKCTKRFLRVHEAYQMLSDPQKRAVYDKDNQKIAQQREWKMRCRAQLEGLKLRAKDPNSWAAAVVRAQTALGLLISGGKIVFSDN